MTEMKDHPLIQLKDVSFSYSNQQPVINNCSFQITTEKVGLIGDNGSGKTTLLHLMVGLLRPHGGHILFHGSPVQSKKELRVLRKEVGFLFQNSNDQLFSPTVLEDVAFGPLNFGYPAEQAVEVARSTLQDLGLEDFETRVTHRLSGGEKKLVALATILVMKPRLLLLDEPTNNLDLNTRNHLTTILNNSQVAHLIISHDYDFLSETTDQLYTLENGHLHRCPEGQIHVHRHVHAYGDKPHHHN